MEKKVSFWPIWDHIQSVRKEKWPKEAIKLANKYLSEDPENVQAYLQLMDIYYVSWELEKAEKPVDFLLKKNIWEPHVKKSILYYVKALLLAEKLKWAEAKKWIKKALKEEWLNLEYKRLLAVIEFWSWNKSKWYEIIKEIIEENDKIDAEMLFNAILMALDLNYFEDIKKYFQIYENKEKEITFFWKSKEFYDDRFKDLRNIILDTENSEW